MMKKNGCNQDSFAVSAKLGSAAAFWASKSCIWCSACSLSHAVIPIMMSSMVPVVPKNTRGPRDFRFIPTGIAKRAPATENTQVPNALHKTACKSMSQTILLLTRKIYLNAVFKWQTATKYESSPCSLSNWNKLYVSLLQSIKLRLYMDGQWSILRDRDVKGMTNKQMLHHS